MSPPDHRMFSFHQNAQLPAVTLRSRGNPSS